MIPGFAPVRRAKDAKWVVDALNCGEEQCVSEVVPQWFESYIAILHPMSHYICTEITLDPTVTRAYCPYAIEAHHLTWAEAIQSNLPIVHGETELVYEAKPNSVYYRPNQYRRLPDGGWVRNVLMHEGNDVDRLLQPGDQWISGPEVGTLERTIAEKLARLLHPATKRPIECWFAVDDWKSSHLSAYRTTASISTWQDRLLLFRGPLNHLSWSFDLVHGHQTAKLVWPDDRAWCLGTNLSSHATYIGGTRELINMLHASAEVETRITQSGNYWLWFEDELTPVVEKPANVPLEPAFEAREDPFPAPSRNPELERQIEEWVRSAPRRFRPRIWDRLRSVVKSKDKKAIVFRDQKRK